MTNEKIELTEDDVKLLRLLGDSFMYVRLVASRNGRSNLTDKEKLDLIGEIADASHNLPNVLAEGGHNSPSAFLLHDVPRLKELLKSVRSY
jgi:hypothetical protein